ncbi:DUF6167 family protein [Nocardioides albus]|uniref:Uncharacterized protein n=1 Tax=Nocardioides albus TaxID=1841 RepID=A0A7W5A901_9ACTN|nr:DUF6167 family protein [Nocardioides albus]MBB3091777.1 hypothetical protein [Nocardioides albus]GGU31951.1 hypothetical protein GCM10007979_33750 [Nocardioides albus]
MRGAMWFVVGAGAGVYAMVKGRRAAEAFTADGLRDRAQALGVGARIFRDELATGKAEKELELREWIETTGARSGGELARPPAPSEGVTARSADTRTQALASGSASAGGQKQIGAAGAGQKTLGSSGPIEDPRQNTEGSTP